MHTNIFQLCRSECAFLNEMAKIMMTKYQIFFLGQYKQDFLLYVDVVLNPCFKLKYVRFCFERLYDVEKAENFMKKLKIFF
jgi:hypothetical protein